MHKLINFQIFGDDRGSLVSLESFKNIPFEIKRVYYLYDVPNRADRGGHAHKELHQLVVALSGSFDIELFDGYETVKYTLNQPDQGLIIVPGIWRNLNNFSGGGICLVLASREYDEEDYIRNLVDYQNSKL